MTPNPAIINAVEKLGYRVTVGDVAATAGLDVKVAEPGLLALASDAGGHLQVSESGDIAYLFPKDFQGILRNKYLRLQLQESWQKIWRVLFYLIRISFGIVLLASIVLISIAITILVISMNSDRNSNSGGSRRGGGGGFGFFPRFLFWFGPDWFSPFSWGYYHRPYYYRRQQQITSHSRQSYTAGNEESKMNFLEVVFSFLFGDGNPNYNLEERRWQAIAAVIKNNRGAVVAEQIAPYLDDLGSNSQKRNEEYMLPVLTRFNGRPEVSPLGQIVYHFPELQTTAQEWNSQTVSAYLKEYRRRFSEADSSQLVLAGGLGTLNFVLALILGSLLNNPEAIAKVGADFVGFIVFVDAIYPILLAYGIGFLLVPLVRYYWVQWRNQKIKNRNENRQNRAVALNKPNRELEQKINYARQFAAETVIDSGDLAYTTEQDLLEQEAQQVDKIDAEWQRRLDDSSNS